MERAREKYGWMVYLGLGLLWLVVGLYQVFSPEELLEDDAQHITGMSWIELKASNPAATRLVRFQYGGMGLLKTSWSLLVLVITLTGYRKGEKWACTPCGSYLPSWCGMQSTTLSSLITSTRRCSGSRLRRYRCWGSSFPTGSSSQDSARGEFPFSLFLTPTLARALLPNCMGNILMTHLLLSHLSARATLFINHRLLK